MSKESFLEISSHLGLKKVQEWTMERFSGLSGGEKTKIMLANIWVSQPDLLILDEPTNHMDMEGVEWLVNELVNYQGTALIISHDRYFLDRTVNQIIELDEGTTYAYQGNYSDYRNQKEEKYKNDLHQYTIQKKVQKKIEAEIKRIERWSAEAHRKAGKGGSRSENRQMGLKEFERAKAKKMDKHVKSKKKRLERVELNISKPQEEPKVTFDFEKIQNRGKRIIEAKGITKRYGDRILFQNSSFYVRRGERIGLIGDNGCGKTTLLQMILGNEGLDKGEIWVSPSAKMAFLSQDVTDLNGEQSPLELLHAKQILHGNRIRHLLTTMGFDEEMLNKSINHLSLGERTRLKIAQLILMENDLLLLDEPTNHLDLHCREQLEETLTFYNGTILMVSHDRFLLEKICNKLLVIEDGKIKKIEGGFKEYKEKQEKAKNTKNVSKDGYEDKMLIETRLVYLLGELDKYKPNDPQYKRLDLEFKELVARKKE